MNYTRKSLIFGLGFIVSCCSPWNYLNKWQLIPPALSSEKVAISSDIPKNQDGVIFRTIMDRAIASNLSTQSMGEIIQTVAQQLLGAKYEAGLLDKSTKETLFVSLQKFDCLLLVESVLALAHNIALKDQSYHNFTEQIEDKRYWNGTLNGYCSRLHYFSDWIKDNQRRGNLSNITQNLGGVYLPKQLNFMTTHKSSYPILIASEANYQCIASVEESLTGEALNYIPQKNIAQIYNQLQPGDIIGVATNIPGLDVTHTGFVYRHPNGNIGLLHASPAGKVVIAPDLQQYVGKVDNAIGIIVVRANKPLKN
ncbi:MAG: DUF1460 domain-containing protein [Pleurocapsa sp.]